MTIDIKVTERPKLQKPKILQMDIKGNVIKEWDSYNDIFAETGYGYTNISNCCHGRLTKAYGYKWAIKE